MWIGVRDWTTIRVDQSLILVAREGIPHDCFPGNLSTDEILVDLSSVHNAAPSLIVAASHSKYVPADL